MNKIFSGKLCKALALSEGIMNVCWELYPTTKKIIVNG